MTVLIGLKLTVVTATVRKTTLSFIQIFTVFHPLADRSGYKAEGSEQR